MLIRTTLNHFEPELVSVLDLVSWLPRPCTLLTATNPIQYRLKRTGHQLLFNLQPSLFVCVLIAQLPKSAVIQYRYINSNPGNIR